MKLKKKRIKQERNLQKEMIKQVINLKKKYKTKQIHTHIYRHKVKNHGKITKKKMLSINNQNLFHLWQYIHIAVWNTLNSYLCSAPGQIVKNFQNKWKQTK